MFQNATATTNNAQAGTPLIDLQHHLNAAQSNTQASSYQAAQYDTTFDNFAASIDQATHAESASVERAAIIETLKYLDGFRTALVARNGQLEQQAKAEEAVEKTKQLIANGITDPEVLIAALAASRPATTKARKSNGTAKRDPYPKAQKVYEYLAVPDHNNYKWGYTQSLRNMTEETHPWAKRLDNGKPDPAYFRLATDEERAEMQRRRDEYIAARAPK